MTTLFEDSDRRCPRDGKRMLVEIGQQDDVGGRRLALVEMVHACWSCGYTERDDQWKRPGVRVSTGPTMAERLYAQRMGVEVPMRYDTSPFPEDEWDDARP